MKGSWVTWRNPGLILGLIIIIASLVMFLTMFSNVYIGGLHLFLFSMIVLALASVVLSFVYIPWVARWEQSRARTKD